MMVRPRRGLFRVAIEMDDKNIMSIPQEVTLAIVISHPVQYYSPWFRTLAATEGLCLRVFYLWDSGVQERPDKGFGRAFAWDIPLLDGYEHEFVPNLSSDPGTHHFSGLDNPGLVEAIVRWSPDAVLLFGYAWKEHLKLLFSRRLKTTPFIFRGDSHDLCPETGVRSLVRRLMKRVVFRRFDHFLSVGSANRDFLLGLGVSSNKVTIAPHCIDNQRFRDAQTDATGGWKESLGIESERAVILFVGKFETKKRPLDLLDAFLGADFGGGSKTVPALVFVGDGIYLKAMQDRAGEEIGRSIFFVPFLNQTEIPRAYSAGDVLVLPSVGSGETWGLVVNEAMNLKTPAIVSDQVGCWPDLVIPGETGWVFEAGNVMALRKCLEEAVSDPVKLAEMGAKAKKHIENFSYEVAAEGLMCALSKVVEQGGRS